jgi:activator of HSP90 ATPase
MPKTIRQTVTFEATPREVYEALMDSRKHAQFTGAKASISREAGGRFTAYDGSIQGRNLELAQDAKIVQAWRCAATGWREDHYSTVTITLESIDGTTRLTLNHEDVPEPSYDECTEGWQQAYWEKMKATFAW